MSWHAKKYGAYTRDSTEAIENANQIYGILSKRGWTINAVCGLLGNIGAESSYNPWRWQSDDPLNSWDKDTISNSAYHGYGLVQWTPAGSYIDNAKSYSGYAPNYNDKAGSPSDGIAQITYMDDGGGGYYPTSGYPETYDEFKSSTKSPSYLAAAFCYNYERPADPIGTMPARQDNANYWWTVLDGTDPPDPDQPGPTPDDNGSSMPLWFYLKRRW